MKRIELSLFLIAAAVVLSVAAFGQRGHGASGGETPDAVVDGLKFHRIRISIQVTDVATGKSLGTIVVPPNSEPVFAVVPAYEDKVRTAYKKYSEGKVDTPARADEGSNGAARQPGGGLTVDGIVGMLKAGISEDIISEKIQQSGQSFNLSTDDMIRLKNAKASNALIKTMMEAGPASGGGASQPAGGFRQSASPVEQSTVPGPATGRQGDSILQPSELEQLNNGTVHFDLNFIRVHPNLLQEKPVMQYFIALNNCNDSTVERALQNELDYAALASFYGGRAAEILAGLPDTAGIMMFGGDRITASTGDQAWVLWGRRAVGNAPIPRTLTLGEFDISGKVFPIIVSDKSKTIDLAGTQQIVADRGSLKKSCPVAYNTLLASQAATLLPTTYSVSIPSMTFSELAMSEGDARKYIESVGSAQRNIVLGVDLHLKPGGKSAKADEFAYDGTIARVTVLRPERTQTLGTLYQPLGTLYDDHSLPPIQIKKIPSAITTMKSTREFNEEVITAVYVSQAADACGWPISPEQKANLKRYIYDVDTYGKFNDRASINGVMASVRNGINDPSRHFCENPTERQDFNRRAATVWPKGPMAAPAN